MVSVNLQGGLGNQMFQIATVYAYAMEHGFEYGLNFDSCHTPNQGNSSTKYKDTFFKNISRLDDTKFNMVYKEPSFSYNKISKNGNILLDGYFQSEKYFKEYGNVIKNLFIYPDEIYDKVYKFIIKLPENFKPLTSIHVRRGDYLNKSEFHKNLFETDYYHKAMEMVGGNFIIISDDMNWCKENFKGDNIIYSPFNDELLDLFLMSYCDNQIIANSSFSWWGAYLKKRDIFKDSKVIAPKEWFGPMGPKDTEDIIPENWIKI